MEYLWYWKSQGRVQGPLTTEELDVVIRRDRVLDGDEIRLDETEDWLRAADVKQMFASESVSPSEAATELLSQSNRRRLRLSEEITDESPLVNWLKTGAEGILGLVENARDVVSGGVGNLLHRLGTRGRLAILGGIAIVLLSLLLKDIQYGESLNRRVYVGLAARWERMQSLRESEVSAREWTAFRDEALAELQPDLAALQEQAERNPIRRDHLFRSGQSTATIRREILFAGRSLAKMLTGAPEWDLRAEQSFRDHFGVAEGYYSGELQLVEHSGIGRESERAADAATGQAWGAWEKGILITDGLLIVVGLLFWWARRRRQSISR